MKKLFISALILPTLLAAYPALAQEQPNYIDIGTPTANKRLVIAEVRLEKPGFITIQRDKNNAPGPIVAFSQYLKAGEVANVRTILFPSKGKTYWAVLRADNGDKKFQSKKDLAVKDATGNFVQVKFTVNNVKIPPPVVKPAMANVTIQNFAFSPSALTVKKGTVVIFTNADSVAHTVTASEFDSGQLQTGQSFKLDTSNLAPGTYNYSCTIHPSMTGSLIVQ